MKITRVLHGIAWLVLSLWLVIWVWEGLFGTDVTDSILPFNVPFVSPMPGVLVGTAWGCLMTFTPGLFSDKPRVSKRKATELAIGQVIKADSTGLTVNDVPQYDIFVRVMPAMGSEFIGQLRTLIGSAERELLEKNTPIPVRFNPEHHDDLILAEDDDAAARQAMLNWRLARGLVSPEHARAFQYGIQAPASVVAIKPTGARKDAQVEVALRVLIAPPSAPSWEAETSGYVFPEALAALQVGSPVTAWYLPSDPLTVALTNDEG